MPPRRVRGGLPEPVGPGSVTCRPLSVAGSCGGNPEEWVTGSRRCRMLRCDGALDGEVVIRSFFRHETFQGPSPVFPPGPVLPVLPFDAPAPVLAAIEGAGRTEDLRFSPDNRLLAIAAHVRNVVLLLRVRVEGGPSTPSVSIEDFAELTSKTFGGLHGVDWLDSATLVTGNRDGRVAVVRVPERLGGQTHAVEPLSVMKAGKLRSNLFARPHSPGSLVVTTAANGQPALLVCNNYKDRVTQHFLDAAGGFRPTRHRVAINRGLNLPDGIAASADGRWVVVASHLRHEVNVYDAAAGLTWRTPPVARLRGTQYPHGLRFGPGGRLFVVDAGSPYLFWYDGGAPWSGVHQPSGRVRVMDNETFESERPNLREGGAKGIDLDSTGAVLAITCHQVPLRLFAVNELLQSAESVV